MSSIFCALLYLYLQNLFGVHSTSGIFGLGNGLQRVCFCRCGLTNEYDGTTRTGRVSGEWYTGPHEYPWVVAINIGSQVITGSLISDRHVLTAASPIYGVTPDHITVTLGAHDRCATGAPSLNVSVESIILRPGYSPMNLENNLALIKLKYTIAFSDYISPVCLPLFGSRDKEQVTWTAGWSPVNISCIPRVAILPTLPAAACFQQTEKISRNSQGCLSPLRSQNDACKNDVGSPVMTRWNSNAALRIVGVISTSSCDLRTPTLYTRTIDNVDWIFENIRGDCQCV